MFLPLHQAISEVSEEVTDRFVAGGVEYIGIPSGIRTLDVMTGGFRKGELSLMGGRTGLGKSSLALTCAQHQAELGYSVGYITLEMSANLLAYRWLASDMKLNAMAIERGRITREQLTIIQNKHEHINNLKFYIDDSTYKSHEIEKALKKLDEPLDILYVDYLTLLRDDTKENESERLAKISANLKDLAKSLDIPVVALVQLNRETEKRANNRPTVSDIRGSGAPEQDAGFVALLYRPHYYKMLNDNASAVDVERDAEIVVVKNRFGPMGSVEACFYAKEMRWGSR